MLHNISQPINMCFHFFFLFFQNETSFHKKNCENSKVRGSYMFINRNQIVFQTYNHEPKWHQLRLKFPNGRRVTSIVPAQTLFWMRRGAAEYNNIRSTHKKSSPTTRVLFTAVGNGWMFARRRYHYLSYCGISKNRLEFRDEHNNAEETTQRREDSALRETGNEEETRGSAASKAPCGMNEQITLSKKTARNARNRR